ncbi:MAG TPA: TMEM175 family protein [Burkholderiaceae bacterium]
MPDTPLAPAAERERGYALFRIEAFSDAVFGFALTLLVVSLDVPKSAAELFATMRGFVAFGVCFAFLAMLWCEHNRYFKRYPLSDVRTVALNMLLLFVVLLYVYPMKFLFTQLTDAWLWGVPGSAIKSSDDVRQLMQIYGLGFFAINAVLYLMHRHAWNKRAELELTAASLATLRGSLRRNIYSAAIAVVSVCIARFTSDAGLLAGLCYSTLGFIEPLNARITVKARRAAEAAMASQHATESVA